MAIIKLHYPDDREKQRAVFERLMATSTTKSAWRSPYLHQMLLNMADDADVKEFDDLKNKVEDEMRQEIIVKRCGVSHQKASHFTPAAIKALRPEIVDCMRETTPLSAILTWQPAMNGFQAYYPRTKEAREKHNKPKQYLTTGKKYGEEGSGGVTQLQALTHCVKHLWACHEKLGTLQLWA